MLHIIKLAVGAKDIDDLRGWQAERALVAPPLRHRTRNAPKRREEVLDGGSLYWVVSGALLVRQRIVDIIEDVREDGSACAALVLDPVLVPLAGRAMRPFQGWRYLDPADAPPDLAEAGRIAGLEVMPAAMQRELRALCLL
jgi:hypothetical protein